MSHMLPKVSFSVSSLNQCSSGDLVELSPRLSHAVDTLHYTQGVGTAQSLRAEHVRTTVLHT